MRDPMRREVHPQGCVVPPKPSDDRSFRCRMDRCPRIGPNCLFSIKLPGVSHRRGSTSDSSSAPGLRRPEGPGRRHLGQVLLFRRVAQRLAPRGLTSLSGRPGGPGAGHRPPSSHCSRESPGRSRPGERPPRRAGAGAGLKPASWWAEEPAGGDRCRGRSRAGGAVSTPNEAGMPDAAVKTGFFRIPLDQLKADTILGFDLYIQHGSQEPVLFRARRLSFTEEHRARLERSGSEALLVPEAQRPDYEAYVQEHSAAPAAPPLRPREEIQKELAAVTDPKRPLRRRCRIVLDTSRELLQHAFIDPSVPGLPESMHDLAKSTGHLLLAERDALRRLVSMFRLDYETISHSTNTAVYTVALARAGGIEDPVQLAAIGRAALVHDIGMAAAGEERPPGAPDALRDHPEAGARILEEAGWNDGLCLEVCRAHHERYDGSGYPRGLKGGIIHPVARMVAIADTYDELTSARPGWVPLTGFQALWKMSREMSGRFDPGYLELFIRMLLGEEGRAHRPR
ncbi:MAG: HD domain-containing protein [Acidobacteria bacterium]|nr:MAG: HD domain-containing protein [Acidobacteriota bacterium]